MTDLPKFPCCCLDVEHYCERDVWREKFVARLSEMKEIENYQKMLGESENISDFLAREDDRGDCFELGRLHGRLEKMTEVLEAFRD